ncbi:hypothetical protein K438DRAFT_670630 [Mycena galopus ATCC 62051]|nr:hypothetical protein K438DRAFT_670630 [Mycena galopus ATCC 62051]
MDVTALYHPHFHPIHSEDMINLYGVDKVSFDTYSPVHDVWKVSSATTPPQFVEKDTVMQFRTRGVRAGIGMPSGSILRLDGKNCIQGSSATSQAFISDTTSLSFASPIPHTPTRAVLNQSNFASSSTAGSSVSILSPSPSPFSSPTPQRTAVESSHLPIDPASIPSGIYTFSPEPPDVVNSSLLIGNTSLRVRQDVARDSGQCCQRSHGNRLAIPLYTGDGSRFHPARQA